MFKRRVNWLLMIATALAWTAGVGSAKVLVCPVGTNDSMLKGTYNYNFIGSVQNQAGNLPVAGTGSFTADGEGHLSAAGVAHCNILSGENNSTVTGGCYAVNADGTGTITIATSSQFCESLDSGVDLRISVSRTSTQVLFSSDGNEPNFNVGHVIPFSGTANKINNQLPIE